MEAVQNMPDLYAGQRTEPGPVHEPVFPVDLTIDLKRHDVYARGVPIEAVTALRKAPIFWHPEDEENEPGFWVLTRQSDIRQVSTNPELFSSEIGAGALLSFDGKASLTPRALEIRRANMVHMDPPDHRNYRALVMPFISGTAAKDLEPMVQAQVADLVQKLPAGEPFDLVSRFTAITPGVTLCALLGVPEQDREMVIAWGDMLAAVGDPAAAARVSEISRKVYDYGWALLEDKKKNPGNDLLSAAIALYSKSNTVLRPYSMESLFSLFLVAGHRTTRNSTTEGLLQLYRHPDQLEMLRNDPKLINNAVKEILRYTTVVPLFRRTATRDTEIAGQKIAAGEKLALWYTAANRDETVFADPDRFDITRKDAGKNIAFGFGEHVCPGNMVGRMQIANAISAFVSRFRQMDVLSPPEYLPTNHAVSISRVMVRAS